jgi:glycosyltransferase involved in cell wall biosynthesis
VFQIQTYESNMKPFFSITISLYNKENYIKSTIESVLAQTFQDFEIIVVNDGSTDGSEHVVKSISDDRIKYFSQQNKGASAARNLAISKGHGTYIALLDADDLWQDTYLETIHRLIESYPDQMVFATAVTIETSGNSMPSVYSIPNIKEKGTYVVDYFQSSFINTLLTSSSTVVHYSIFKKTGMYDTSIQSGQDTDLWIRIGIHFKIVFINETLVRYRYVEQSLSNSTKRAYKKSKLDGYLNLERTNLSLKKFMDLNRFSMAIVSKLGNDQDSFKHYEKGIDSANLNRKQRFLLKQPAFILKQLHYFKKLMQQSGVHFSAFK